MSRLVEKQKQKFLEAVRHFSNQERCPSFYGSVKDALEHCEVNDAGIAELGFEYDGCPDIGDEVFNTIYHVERLLKCRVDTHTQKYKYDKVIDGVENAAVRNPLVINWNVNIGSIKIEDGGKSPCAGGIIKRFIKRFIKHLLFLIPEDRTGSYLVWLIVLNGILCYIAWRRVFQ